MAHRLPHSILVALAGLVVSLAIFAGRAVVVAADPSDATPATSEKALFNRDIRPILSENCFFCHGPDKAKRKAEMRLDVRDDAIDHGAIVPGEPDESEIVARIFSSDPKKMMPPPDSRKKLTEPQKKLLERWIVEGGEYQAHWAYLKPVKPPTPAGQNPIDALIQSRLQREGLAPAAEADRRLLIRRLDFDLLGLPPKPEETDAFIADKSADAYERLVDKTLASPHYGERMAIGWLDVVRFADTIGYHSDTPRNVWPYRDYVIKAFNENKPFDQFTIEQLAGDLLPASTQEQKVASCFNRLLLSTEEGGAQAKDYEARMLTDRVRAMGTVWLGQTLGCCNCHDHKFDPMTQHDFFAMGAFFADIQEPIIGRREDGMAVPDAKQTAELARLDADQATAQKQFDDAAAGLTAQETAWEQSILSVLDAKVNFWGLLYPQKGAADRKVALAADQQKKQLPPAEIIGILKIAVGQRNPAQQGKLAEHFKGIAPELAAQRAKLADLKKQRGDVEAQVPKCLVSISASQPRVVHMLARGNFLAEIGDPVQPDTPHFLPPLPVKGRKPTRLDLARWVVSPDNPLTARVFVNRIWKQFFGVGISKSLDDLGSQGESPVNPELLDWLACDFVEHGWDVKHLIHTIVLSRAYRQTSIASDELLTRDPANRLIARQSRFRLDAELVRDNALDVAGLLVTKIGGPSVKPYQPDGYWENLNFPQRSYDADKGENQYRRGLYVWWQRSFMHPSLLAFDAPTREECVAERNRSNIPQQALVLLNDPTYVEAARAFAARIMKQGGGNTDDRLNWAWREALQRPPRDDERTVARDLLEKQQARFTKAPSDAEKLLHVGFAPAPADLPPADLAAWTSVARVILNLHETITRE